MTVIARWDPFREFTTLQDRMNRLFRDSFGSDGRDEALTSTGFAPPADVYEDEHPPLGCDSFGFAERKPIFRSNSNFRSSLAANKNLSYG